jgi:cyclin C
MEFYLVDELECDLVVFHPYRTLMTLCGKDDGTAAMVIEAGELGAGGEEFVAGPGEVWDGNGIKRYWGSGQGKLLLDDKTLQLAWLVLFPLLLQESLLIRFGLCRLIINDTYRTDVCLKYPPFVIAIAAIYLALVNHDCCSQSSPSAMTPIVNIRATRRTSNPGSSGPDPVTFLAKLNVSMTSIASIAQEMISLYSLWSRYSDDSGSGSSNLTPVNHHPSKAMKGRGDQTPGDSVDGEFESSNGAPEKYRARQMAELVVQMRERKEKEVSAAVAERTSMVSPATRAGGSMGTGGRVVNKRLERAQAAG